MSQKTNYNSIIVGGGEIGTSLGNVLKTCHKKNKKYSQLIVDIKDKDYSEKLKTSSCNTMHVAIPFFNKNEFVKNVIKYYKAFNPKLIIIHSTVVPGTTEMVRRKTTKHVAFSPVRGNHPDLTEYIQKFVKYFSCPLKETSMMVFREMPKIRMRWYENDKLIELSKLLCTTYYGVCIEWHREAARMFNKYKLPVDFLGEWNKTYNEGYLEKMPNVTRPILYPPKGKIGGHCVVPNAKLLKKIYKSKFLDIITK